MTASRERARRPRPTGRNLAAGIGFLAVGAALTVGYAAAVVWLAGALRPASARYFAPPDFAFLMVVAFLPCLFAAFLLVNVIAALCVPSLRRGITWNRALSIVAVLSSTVLLLGALSGATATRTASASGVAWREPWELQRHAYSWSQVAGVALDTRVANGRGGPYAIPELWLDYADGHRANFWRTPTHPFEQTDAAGLEALAALIAAHQIPVRQSSPPSRLLPASDASLYNQIATILGR